jgi:hypothetical protein
LPSFTTTVTVCCVTHFYVQNFIGHYACVFTGTKNFFIRRGYAQGGLLRKPQRNAADFSEPSLLRSVACKPRGKGCETNKDYLDFDDKNYKSFQRLWRDSARTFHLNKVEAPQVSDVTDVK